MFFSYYFALQDLRYQKHFYFESIHEISTYQNIISLIKQNSSFNPNKEYDLIFIGRLSYRGVFSGNNAWGGHYTQGSFSSIHLEDIFNFFERKSYVRNLYQILNLETAQAAGINLNFLTESISPSHTPVVHIKD